MEHVVFYPGADGTPAFARFAAMDEAVSFVERLRNADGVSEASLYGLTPVPMVVRAYYKVEVPPPVVPTGAIDYLADPVPVAETPARVAETPAPALETPTLVPDVRPAVAEAPAEPPVPAQPVAEEIAADPADAGAEPTPAKVGTPDIIAPTPNGRRSLGFFTH